MLLQAAGCVNIARCQVLMGVPMCVPRVLIFYFNLINPNNLLFFGVVPNELFNQPLILGHCAIEFPNLAIYWLKAQKKKNSI